MVSISHSLDEVDKLIYKKLINPPAVPRVTVADSEEQHKLPGYARKGSPLVTEDTSAENLLFSPSV